MVKPTLQVTSPYTAEESFVLFQEAQKSIDQFNHNISMLQGLKDLKANNKGRINILCGELFEKCDGQNRQLVSRIIQCLFQSDQTHYQAIKGLFAQNNCLYQAILEYLRSYINEFEYACELYRKDLNKVYLNGDMTFKIGKSFNTIVYSNANIQSDEKVEKMLYKAYALMRTRQALSSIKKHHEDELDHCKNILFNTVTSLHTKYANNNKTDLNILYHSSNIVVHFFMKIANVLTDLFFRSPIQRKEEKHHYHFQRFFFSSSEYFTQQVGKIKKDLMEIPKKRIM